MKSRFVSNLEKKVPKVLPNFTMLLEILKKAFCIRFWKKNFNKSSWYEGKWKIFYLDSVFFYVYGNPGKEPK